MPSFYFSVRQNQFGKTRKQKLLHRTVKSKILDASASFRTHLWSNPTLESSGQTLLLLWRQLRGYKTMDPTTKHQKSIPAQLFLHIYKRTNVHLNTAINKLIAGAFFFGMRSCKYSTTPKGEGKFTCILQKGDICVYRKLHKLSHEIGILFLANKVSPVFHTQKNRVKNATLTKCWTSTTLCLVRI